MPFAKQILIFVAIVSAIASAIVYDAAAAAASIDDNLQQAGYSESTNLRVALFDQVQSVLNMDAFDRASWHAGFLEEASWAAETRAHLLSNAESVEMQQADLRSARDLAVASVRLAPVSPATWHRLAILSNAGLKNPTCDAAKCLERSFRAAKVTDPALMCARVDAGIRLGLITSPSDPKIQALRVGGFEGNSIIRCMKSASSKFIFGALLLANDGF